MGHLNLMCREGFVHCHRCLVQFPESLLACPACSGLIQDERGRWVAPPSQPVESQPAEEQSLLFDAGSTKYPA